MENSNQDNYSNTNKKPVVAVIGAGPAGITAAYCLAKSKKVKVLLFEADSKVGGLSKTIDLWDCKVDIGPHRFFSNDRRINELWLEVMQQDYQMITRLTRILYKGKFFFYPLKPFNVLNNLGLRTAIACVFSYIKEKFYPYKQIQNFQDFITKAFGAKLYKIFFKTYTEKLWGIPCTELDADFASQRIKKLNLFSAILNALLGGRGNKHKSLIDRFAYPNEGSGMLYEKMQQKLLEWGAKLYLSTKVGHIHLEDGKAKSLTIQNGKEIFCDYIVSSMPLTLLVEKSHGIPDDIRQLARKLTFRNTVIVYLKVNALNLFPDNWLYVHSENLSCGRITNFSNWVPYLHQNKQYTILAMEYWCYDHDTFWKESDNNLIKLAKEELVQTGLLGKQTTTELVQDGFVYRVHRSYPVYRSGYKNLLKPIENFFRTIPNLNFIGRYGSFKYNNQDHSILMGLLASENILGEICGGGGHDLWAINTDYDKYDDAFNGQTLITQQGLKDMRKEGDSNP